MNGSVARQITIHAVTDFAPNTAWVHTHGMARFDYPDLEWYWSPPASCGQAGELLNKIAEYLVAGEVKINIGDTLNLPGEKLLVQFAAPISHEADDFDGNPVLRVHKLTTGEEGASLFRRQVVGNELHESRQQKRAVELHLQGRFVEAWLEYEKILQAEPDNIYALTNIGYLLLNHHNVEDSIPVFKRVIELVPTYALPHNNLGNAFLRLGKLQEAIGEYVSASLAEPTYAMPHRNLALAYHLLGRTAEAIEEYEKYFSLAPAGTKDADAHYNLGVMLEEKKQRNEAIGEYERAIADDPQHARALNNLGLIYFAQGEFDKATVFYERAIAADQGFALALYNLGIAFAAQGEHEKAIEQFKQACRIDPGSVQAASNLGVMYSTAKRFAEAIEILEELTTKEPQQATLHFNLGIAYQGAGLAAKARREFRKVIKLEPKQSRRAQRAQHEIEDLARGSKRSSDAKSREQVEA